MASHAQAYRENPDSARGNLSPFRLRQLVRYSGIPVPQRHLIEAALEISQNAGVVIWSSVESLSDETKMSPRTIYHRRWRMRKLQLWKQIREPYTWDDCPKCGEAREVNTCGKCAYRCDHAGHPQKPCPQFRRTPTFLLNVEKIASWPRPKGVRAGSYKENRDAARKQRQSARSSGHRSTSHASPAAEQPEVRGHQPVRDSGISRAKHREMQFRQNLGIRMAQLMKGVNSVRPPEGGMGHRVGPGDEGYVASLSREEAECAAAREFGITPDEVADHLKLMHWRFAEEERKE
jgi:hypothetical protein